jgi:Cu/Ag efflux protein CusF
MLVQLTIGSARNPRLNRVGTFSSKGTNPATAGLSPMFRNRENAMKIAKIILAGISALAFSSAVLAQQARTGTITVVDRINGTVAIKQTQNGTIGANTGGAAEQFKVQDGSSLDTVHAGDKVTFSTTEKDGIQIITTLKKQ